MSQFLLRETLKRKQHTNVRFINKRTDDAKSVGNISSSSNTTLSSVGTVSAPTFVSHVGTMGATSSTHESSLPTSSNQSSVSTSVQSSTPASTTSSIPRSTTNGSESVEENIGIQHQGYLLGSIGLDGCLYIGVRDKDKGYSEMHREQYEDNNAETKVEIENLKKLVETQREQYEDIQQKYEDV
ncbi:unnamed protein product [Lactuca saligna]|uniref:Uncharacterized protein n=1 Tax=Lactuca saligna TaxID=75948 RepID=A0AA35ZZS8_LACSI|nr:unnamed protein product [Lactuca saligna]